MAWSERDFKVYGVPDHVKEAFKRRAAYYEVYEDILEDLNPEELPKVPTQIIKSMIHKSVNKLFPSGTTFTVENEQLKNTLQDILEQTCLVQKLKTIGIEGHITGTVALKSVWLQDQKRWSLEIHPREALTIKTADNNPDKIEWVQIRYRFYHPEKDKFFWYQERWNADFFLRWEMQEETLGGLPDFRDESAKITSNVYGEIPFTIIKHKYKLNSPYGEPEISDQDIEAQSRIAISRDGTELTHQKYAEPPVVIINGNARQLSTGPGSTINVTSSNPNVNTDVKLLEIDGVPDSVFTFEDRVIDSIYEASQVTSPSVEKNLKAGGIVSFIAYRAANQAFIEKIKANRTMYGVNGVEKHLEFILRAGKLLSSIKGAELGLKGYDSVNLEDETTYNVETVYPPIFELSIEEKIQTKHYIESLPIPAREKAERIAALENIRDERLIIEMARTLEEREEAALALAMNERNFAEEGSI